MSSRSGVGSILAACYAPVPCTPRVTVSVGGQVVARSAVQTLGVDELGVLSFKLGSAGRSMLRRATGNQLAARIVISGTGSGSGSGGRIRAVGAVALVGYR